MSSTGSRLLRWLVLAALVAALAAGAYVMTRPKPIAVVVKAVDRGLVEATVVNTRAGSVEACQRTRLSTIMGGRIEFLGVKEGDAVKKGQLLLKLWNDDQRAQQTLAEAQRKTAEQRVREVCTVAAAAGREAERQKTLRLKGFVSEAREDAARSEAEAKAAGCETARADVAQAAARVTVTRAEQGRMVLYAPFDGTVAKIVGELGEYSTPSPPGVPTPPAIDLIDESCLYIKAPMDEIDAPRIALKMPVRVRFDALPKQSFPGMVKRIAAYVTAVEKQSRTVDVEVEFQRPPHSSPIRVGASADVEIVLEERPAVLRIPTAALIEGRRVLLFNRASGKLESREVTPGLANWEFTEISAGLAEGEEVVMSLEREGVKAGAAATVAEGERK